MQFDVKTFDVQKFDAILARGLSAGKGYRDGQMCIEAAICAVLDLPHDDDPQCVSSAVRSFKIGLNDKRWSTPLARAAGLRDLGLAQLGSKGVVDDAEFIRRLSKGLIMRMIPTMARQLYPNNQRLMDAVAVCEAEGSAESARTARDIFRNIRDVAAADAAYAADAAAYVAYAAAYVADAAAYVAAAAYAAAYAADVAAYAADAAAERDKYLNMAASIALDVLKEMKSPGCELLEKK